MIKQITKTKVNNAMLMTLVMSWAGYPSQSQVNSKCHYFNICFYKKNVKPTSFKKKLKSQTEF